MLIDGHIHYDADSPASGDIQGKLKDSGIDGGIILSVNPGNGKSDFRKCIADVMEYSAGLSGFLPFFWVDAIAGNAVEQVEEALEAGIAGFKVICDRYYPYEDKPMQVFRAIAATGKPLLLHSGILWDGPRMSSLFNRPANFECLFEIPKLKFAMAHVGWPWYDEYLAVFGKWAVYKGKSPDYCEMFIDVTPGTPEIYREEVLTKIFRIGYDVKDQVFFGSDNFTGEYSVSWVKNWIARDKEIYRKLGLPETQIEKIFSGNVKRFLEPVS